MNEEREYYFRASQTPNQPLILVLDAEWKIGRSLEVMKYFKNNTNGSFDPTIVGLKNTERFRDVTPTVTEDPGYPKTGGNASNLIKFIKQELLPVVYSKLDQPVGGKVIVGHSGSGLFASYLFLTEPEAFDNYLVISPSLHYDYDYTLKLAKTEIEEKYSNQEIFFSVGSLEPQHMITNCQTFKDFLDQKKPLNLRWGIKVIENETHGSTYEKSFYAGLLFFFSSGN